MKLAVSLLALLLIQVSYGFLLPGARITDGEDAEIGEFPYQVSIEFRFYIIGDYIHICSGSIINEHYVLTAAQCVKDWRFILGNIRVKAGKHVLNSEDDFVQTSKVDKKILHEKFSGDSTLQPNDIALLKLETPLVFNKRVQPIQLPKQDQEQSGDALVTGWGGFKDESELTKRPIMFKKATLPILKNEECKDVFDRVKGSPIFAESMICSGPGGSTSACVADGGSPYTQMVDGKYVLVGVAISKANPCDTTGVPLVYTRVSSFVDWINKTIKN